MSTKCASRGAEQSGGPAIPAILLAAAGFLLLNGVAGASPECPNAENLVSNCGFETNTDGWDVVMGDSLTQDADAHTGSFSGLLDAETGTFVAGVNVETCIEDVGADKPYEFGAWAKLDYEGFPSFNCGTYVIEYGTGSLCAGTEGGETTTFSDLDTSTFTESRTELRTAATTEDVLLGVFCNNADLVDFLFFLDDVFFAVDHTVFADGFNLRDGDTCEWSFYSSDC